MTTAQRPIPELDFLSKSVSGRELLALDWSAHPLGPPERWPLELRITLANMTACPTAMFLAWGPGLTSFFNDAYRPLFGDRLPRAAGAPFREIWGDVWETIGPLVDKALAGEASRFTDLPIPMARYGEPEETFWTFSYSPVFDAAGAVAGMMCVTEETTQTVRADAARRRMERHRDAAMSGPNTIGLWNWDLRVDRVTADVRLADLYGVEPELLREGASIGEFFATMLPEDLPVVRAHIDRAIASGEPFATDYRLRHADGSIRWIAVQGRCLRDARGRPCDFAGLSFDVTAQKGVEVALRRSEEGFRGITNSVDHMIWSARPDGFHDFYNERWYEFTGLPAGATGGESWSGVVHPADQDRAADAWRRSLETGEPYHVEHRLRRRAGDYRHVLARARSVRDEDGRIVRWFGSYTDIQETIDAREVLARSREELETAVQARTEALMQAQEQLRQSQKMEAVGQLTGGIAHDFNNLLTGVSGALEMMQARIAQGRNGDVPRYIDVAQGAARRASALTHRLLAFSRRQTLDPKPVDVNRLISGMEELIRRTVGPQVPVEVVGAGGLWPALVDPNQLENALLNLCINARDAMPDGGRITVETANKWLDETAAKERDLPAGQYLSICVTDTGSGMTPQVIARAFEPFFTTKPLGQGTGLGLSMIYGFARQSGGQVRIYSEPGQGTTVCVYLPRHYGEGERDDPPPDADDQAPGSGERVLIVDDEPTVRMLIAEVLAELGYAAEEAADGPSALRIVQSGVRIDLLVTDVGLPGGMNGRQVADAARALRPGLKVLFITGYAENAVIGNGQLEPGMAILTKPFAMQVLATKVQMLLGG